MEAALRIFSAVLLTTVLALAACTPAEESSAGDEESAAAELSDTSSDQTAPDTLQSTAWRVTAPDGARYVTMLDAGGTYRDLRNGDPWQEGSWTYSDGRDGKQICLEPDHEEGVERCWQPSRMEDDTMIATSSEDRRIELTRVEYSAPKPQTEAGEGGEAAQ